MHQHTPPSTHTHACTQTCAHSRKYTHIHIHTRAQTHSDTRYACTMHLQAGGRQRNECQLCQQAMMQRVTPTLFPSPSRMHCLRNGTWLKAQVCVELHTGLVLSFGNPGQSIDERLTHGSKHRSFFELRVARQVSEGASQATVLTSIFFVWAPFFTP